MSTEQRAISGARTTIARARLESTSARREAASGGEAEREAAFGRLADRHLDASYRLAHSILANPADAQDAVHDAFVTAWRKWETLRETAKFEPWFRRILVNTCRNRLKQRSRRRADDVAVHTTLAVADPSTGAEDRIVVEQALLRLKPDDRILIALRYERDLKLDDIADLLDIPTGTVKWRLHQAHERLRAVIAHTEGTSR